MADDEQSGGEKLKELLMLLCKTSIQTGAQMAALRTLLVAKNIISQKEFDEYSSTALEAAYAEGDLESKILDFLKRFEGPLQ